LNLSTLQGDLLRGSRLFSSLNFAVISAQKTKQLHFLGTSDHLVGPAEAHARLGELFKQLLHWRADHLGE
jgi:hypothetical protein